MIARSADGEFLQDELIRHWETFDDLTADQILILSPKSHEDDRGSASVPHWREPRGLVNRGLKFGSIPTRAWEDKFWAASPVSPPIRRGFYDAFGGTHSPRRPPDQTEKKTAKQTTVAHVANSWSEQIEAASRMLKAVSDCSPEPCGRAQTFEDL